MKYLTMLLMSILLVSIFFGCSSDKLSDAKTAAIIYQNEENAQAYANMLCDSGLTCMLLSLKEFREMDHIDCDLVIVLPKIEETRFSGRNEFSLDFFDKIGNARVLALGDSGANLFELKNLEIGSPNGWHGSKRKIIFPQSVVSSQFGNILRKPNNLVNTDGDVIVEIHPEDVSHVGIYDGGGFPEGTYGIGREEDNLHHWIICKQGNYVLWGINSIHSQLTKEGKQLFVNICSYLANLEPQKLIHPKKEYLSVGSHNGTLKGGGRDKYSFIIDKLSQLRIQLDWNRDNSMMLMTHHPTKRKDGNSPLIIEHNISESMINQEIEIVIGSFSLEEGVDCEYTLTISYF